MFTARYGLELNCKAVQVSASKGLINIKKYYVPNTAYCHSFPSVHILS